MKKLLILVIFISITMLAEVAFAKNEDQVNLDQANDSQSNKPFYIIAGEKERGLTPFPNNERTKKIIAIAELERQGDQLAAQGHYEEALIKFYEAMKPDYLNEESDKSTSQERIVRIHKRQNKLDLAFKEHNEWFYKKFPNHEFTINKHLELLALIKFRDTGSSRPIYEHILYLKKKYKKFLPPNPGMGGLTGGIISDIVHLYNYLGDSEGAIAFLKEILDYLKKNNNGSNADKAQIAEYEQAKKAFEEDRRTGQRGHLQTAIEASNFIGW